MALWKALRSTGVPEVLLHLIVALHENTGAYARLGKKAVKQILHILWCQARLHFSTRSVLCSHRLDLGSYGHEATLGGWRTDLF